MNTINQFLHINHWIISDLWQSTNREHHEHHHNTSTYKYYFLIHEDNSHDLNKINHSNPMIYEARWLTTLILVRPVRHETASPAVNPARACDCLIVSALSTHRCTARTCSSVLFAHTRTDRTSYLLLFA